MEDISTIEQKTNIINTKFIARRIKRELDILISYDICHNNTINIYKNNKTNNYHISFKNIKDNRFYEFIITPNYPFMAPILYLNSKPYLDYFIYRSDKFRSIFDKYKKNKCFCCNTLVCGNNWGPQINLLNIINEVNSFHKDCREIADIVIINVIKRKYLIDDINILEWLYN